MCHGWEKFECMYFYLAKKAKRTSATFVPISCRFTIQRALTKWDNIQDFFSALFRQGQTSTLLVRKFEFRDFLRELDQFWAELDLI